jgi:hypothetical protein
MAAAVTVIATGCGPPQPTATGCAASAVQAIASHGAVTALLGACRRLGPASLSQAVRIAVSQLSDHGDKADHAIWRAAPGIG